MKTNVTTLWFNKNWNYKLGNKYFSVIKTEDNEIYQIGKEFYIQVKKNDSEIMYGKAKIVSLRILNITELTDEMCFLDSGFTKKEFASLFIKDFLAKQQNTQLPKLMYMILKHI